MATACLRRLHILGGHLSRGGVSLTPVRGISAAAQAVLDTRQKTDILESYMSYLDTKGTSPCDHTVLFLHGNPTSAYLWRNIIPHVQGIARCVAPDLIGMGHSGKEPNYQYHFRDHYKYLCAWIDKMAFQTKLNLVIHDWGSGLGFHWANQHRDKVESITFMEAVTGVIPSWDVFPEIARNVFQALRSPGGEEMVLQKNFFVERLLPMAIQRELEDEEMEEYRRPYMEPGESRRPTLTWPREIPIRTDGPQDVVDIVDSYRSWIAEDTAIPKLYFDAQPGFFAPAMRKRFQAKPWPNMKIVDTQGLHFVQEDSPDNIGQELAKFLRSDVFTKVK